MPLSFILYRQTIIGGDLLSVQPIKKTMNFLKLMGTASVGVFVAFLVYVVYSNGKVKHPSDSVTGTLVSTKLSQRFQDGKSYCQIEETFRKDDTKDTCVLEGSEEYSREWEAENGRNELQIGSQKTIWEAPHNKGECYDFDILEAQRSEKNSWTMTFLWRLMHFSFT
jgi:hypothetical protein